MDLWGEVLWFEQLGYAERFWTFLLTALTSGLGGALIGFGGVFLLNRLLNRRRPGWFPWAELLGALPAPLRERVRYPQGLLLTQGLIYAKYHMDDPTVFYNQADLWVRATEKHYDRVQPVEPYYIMWQLPGSDRAEFALMLPFTPKIRQVLIGWIAGLSDGEHCGW